VKKKAKKTTDALEIIEKTIIKGDKKRHETIAARREENSIARQVYALRTGAKLTQKQLADRIGTKASAISRIEDAEYEGHSLGMLRRIADALECDVRVSIVRRRRRQPPTSKAKRIPRAARLRARTQAG